MNAFIAKNKDRWLKFVWFALIVITATLAGIYCYWQFPGLDLYGRDLLMRSRGTLPVPEDIVIVAIDEASIEKLGRFPWTRDLTAEVIEKISDAQAKVITLNVLYAEPSDEFDDGELANAIKNSGKVVVGEQLIEDQSNEESSQSVWLKTLPEIERAAAGIGHVNVPTEFDGTARELFLQLSDDEGKRRWAIALETIRRGSSFTDSEIHQTDDFVIIGNQKIPFVSDFESSLPYSSEGKSGQAIVTKPMRLSIDYIGPTGSFAPRTYSFVDVLEGKIDAEKFRGKYVLVGATAGALGDRIATPFTHFETADGEDQNGELMSGVEILANTVNTVLQKRFYQPLSDLHAALLAAIIAAFCFILIRFTEGRFEFLKKFVALSGLLFLILTGSYFVYVNFLILSPLVPMLVSFVVATPLSLVQRSLTASAGIDARINELLEVQGVLLKNSKTNDAKNDSKTTNFLPHGIEWKTETLEYLSRDLIARSLFVDRALRSLDEGLLIANTDGEITFANRKATEIFDISESRLIGINLTEIFNDSKSPQLFNTQTLEKLLTKKENIKQEISFGEKELNYYEINFSAVVSPDDPNQESIGIVVTLSDITKHRELQKTKDDIITLVTHELRTPLTAIQGMSEVLSEHHLDTEKQKKMLDAINGESKRLARMINEYLDITQLEAGKQKIHFDKVNVKNLLERTAFLLEPFATQHNIKIENSIDNELPLIFGDAEMLGQAFTNLIANAIKYSQAETKVEITYQTGRTYLQISVKDEGMGISQKHLPRIFEKFYRVPKRTQIDVPGTGLGLALTKEIIELHGGSIAAESTLDVGSIFTISLPLI